MSFWRDRWLRGWFIGAVLWFCLMVFLILVKPQPEIPGEEITPIKTYTYDRKRIDVIQLDEGRCIVFRGVGQGGIDCEWEE